MQPLSWTIFTALCPRPRQGAPLSAPPLDTSSAIPEGPMEQRLRLVQGTHVRAERRVTERRPLCVPGQIVWKDARGTTRIASVVTRDVSDYGVNVECLGGVPIPL